MARLKIVKQNEVRKNKIILFLGIIPPLFRINFFT